MDVEKAASMIPCYFTGFKGTFAGDGTTLEKKRIFVETDHHELSSEGSVQQTKDMTSVPSEETLRRRQPQICHTTDFDF